jgi:toxin ParE1/3/4
MSRRLVVSPEAKSDLVDIWRFLSSRNRPATDRVMRDITTRFRMLLDFPESGTKRDKFRSGLRSFPVGSYMVFYFAIEEGIEIVRVLHGRRDIEKIFSDE